MATKKKKNIGAIGAIAGLARAGKDAATIQNKKASKKERQQAKKRLNAYTSGNKSVYVPKQARTASQQTKLQNIQRAQQKTATEKVAEKKPELTAFQKYQNALNQQKKISTAQSTKKVTSPLSNTAYKKQQKKEVERVQSNYTLTGLKKNTEKAGISAKRAHEQAEKEKPTQISIGTSLKLQYLSRLPKAARDKGVGDNLLTDKEKKQVQTNIQAEYNRGSIATGFMSGSMPVADLKKATEKAYGIKLDDSKAKEKLGYKIGEAAGYLGKSAAFGGAGEAAVAKALTKVAAKKLGKKAGSKAVKFGINRASEAIASTPVNVEDAAKNSKDAKEFGKNLAVNAALDAGLGSAVDGIKIAGRAAKYSSAKTIHSAVQKTAKGQALTASEAKAMEKVKKRVEKKRQTGSALNTEERLVNKVSSRGQVVKDTPVKAAEMKAAPAKAVMQETVKPSSAVARPEKKLAKAETTTIKTMQTKEETARKLEALTQAQEAAEQAGDNLHTVSKRVQQNAGDKYETEVNKLADFVYNYKGKGAETHLVPTDKINAVGGGEAFRTLQRASNNDPTYQEVLKAYGKKPSKAQAKEFAEEKIQEDIERYQKTGKTRYIEPEVAKEILYSGDLEDALQIYRNGELKGVKLSDYGSEFTYQGRNPNLQKGTAKRLSADSKAVIQGHKEDRKFSQQVDKALTGELKPSEELTIGKTPQKLQEHGASSINMTMKQNTIKKTAYPAGYMDALKGVETRNTQGHNLGIGTIKNIRKDLENPVAILKSDTQKDSFVVFINKVDRDNRPIMVAVHLDKNGALGVSNEVASEYGRSTYKQFVQIQREKGNVLYENKKIGLDELPGSGLQLPELGDKSDPINTLYQDGVKVNTAKNQAQVTPDEVRKTVNQISDREIQTHAINLMNSDFVSDDVMRAEAMQALKDGAFTKETVSNQKVWEEAAAEVAGDADAIFSAIKNMEGQPTSKDVARCYNLMIQFREMGDTKRWLETSELASAIMSETGRTLQAARMALRTTPEGRIRIANRNLKQLNQTYAERLGEKRLELSDTQIMKIMDAEGDDEIAKVMNEINIEMWNQIPATTFEKFNELRHTAMLLNPRTHIRNIFGNMIFAPARAISGVLSTGLEKGFAKKIEKMGGERTHTFVSTRWGDDKDLFNAARKSFDANYDAAGSAHRYIETQRAADSKVFGDNVLGKIAEKARQFNYKALEKEDMITFKPVYEKSYAKYLKANKIDPERMTAAQREKAHAAALRQAEYATYRDATKLSSMITKAKTATAGAKGSNALGTAAYRAGNIALESLIPFAKTPINILRRGIDYSPIGLMKGVAKAVSAKEPEAFIKGLDEIGAGLTGTGVVALGAMFSDLGYVTVNVGGKTGNAYYERDMGEQDYSVNLSIGGNEYSLSMDWAAPLNLPFFAGAAAFDSHEKEGGTFTDFVTGLAKISEPLMEMSFMSGFTSLLQSNANIDDGSAAGTVVTNLLMTMPQQYMGSFLPSSISQTASITDKYKRDTGSTKEDTVVKSWEQWARQQINKVPGLREKLLEKDVDVWGRYTEKSSTKDYIFEAIKTTLCPATLKKKTYTEADREIIKLSKELDPKSATYIMPEDTFGYAFDLADGSRMKYSEKGRYQRERGQQNYKELTALVGTERYKEMTTAEKKKEIESIYDISEAKADHKLYGAKYAVLAMDKRAFGNSDKHQQRAEDYMSRGGSYEKYYQGYISVETVIRKSHYSGYESKAIGLRKVGADDSLYQVYGVYKKTKDRVDRYFKKDGGSEKEYNLHLNRMSRILDHYGATDSNLNKAMALSEAKSKKRVYRVLGLDNQANIGYGLVKYGYTPTRISKMKDDCAYNFDKDDSGSTTKEEAIAYVNSLGLKDSTEKALVFAAISTAKNPFGSIPDYLELGEESKGSSWGYRRYGRRYRRSGRRGSGRSGSSSGSTSSVSDETALEKYNRALKAQPKKQTVSVSKVQTAKLSHSTGGSQVAKKASYTRKRSSKLDISAYQSDAYKRAIIKLLAKQRKQG